MELGKVNIPKEVYLDFLGETTQIHWDNHAYLMLFIWIIMVPLCIIAIRYGKPKPTQRGIETKISIMNPQWWWFSIHKFGLYIAIGLSIIGAAIAFIVSQGFSGSLHAFFGIATIILGCLQVISSWFRGKHGGRYYYTGHEDDPSSWEGDHYNMTPKRRKFEAYHKSAGYLVGFFAFGAVGSGLMQFPLPGLAIFVFIVVAAFSALWMFLEFKEKRHDGYRAVFGHGMEHPYNESRKEL